MVSAQKLYDLAWKIYLLPIKTWGTGGTITDLLFDAFAKDRALIDDGSERSIQQALIQILAGQRQISRKLDELLNPNRHFHAEHCHEEVITMKGVFTVTLTVEPAAPLPLEVASPEDLGQVGGPLQVPALEISGGTPPYTVALDPSSGPLPPGVSIDGSGNLTGTPTEAGSFEVVVDVSDSLETSGNQPASASVPNTSATGKSTIAASGAAVHGQ